LSFPDGETWCDQSPFVHELNFQLKQTAFRNDPNKCRDLLMKGETKWKDHNGVEHRVVIERREAAARLGNTKTNSAAPQASVRGAHVSRRIFVPDHHHHARRFRRDAAKIEHPSRIGQIGRRFWRATTQRNIRHSAAGCDAAWRCHPKPADAAAAQPGDTKPADATQDATEGKEPEKREDPLSQRFAMLARREQGIVKAQQELKAKEADLVQREKNLGNSGALEAQRKKEVAENPMKALGILRCHVRTADELHPSGEKPTPR